MYCPVCRQKLKNIIYKGQSINVCPYCRGMWLDKGELQQVLDQLISGDDPPDHDINPDTVSESVSPFRKLNSKRICPRCAQPLITVKCIYASNIFLDKCAFCRGVWADKGEVKEIASYIKGKDNMRNLASALVLAQSSIWQSKIEEKVLALAVAVLYLVLGIRNGGVRAASSLLAFLALPLICIFLGENVREAAGGAAAKFIGPFITQTTSARSIITLGWILLLFPAMIGLLAVFLIKLL